MTYFVPIALLLFLVAVVASMSALSSLRARRKPKKSKQNEGPKILIHSINDERCTGCDACVAVCPTNVLDLVDNKSRVLHFEDCIQCEACMWACPTTALVMHPEDVEPPPLKQPDLDENYQTRVPGQYLIGEVAGKPLVKNAANLGRAVVEHMLSEGLKPSGNNAGGDIVDIAIVGSGPGGLSTAITCVHRGLSYHLFDKEHIVASTIARYPKGKLVMAEPYDSANYSLLPVFDSSKEEIIPIWEDLTARLGIRIKLGEAVETVVRQPDGTFEVKTTQARYRARKVVLSTGLRGKPRTLGVPGENQPKVHSLLEDPDDFRGQAVCVTGGGDSALEAAVALADAGAKVVLSYRGKSFNRAAPKNKQAIESYEAQRRIKVKYQSTIAEFGADSVTIKMLDGSQKRYPNQAAFVLIGADPPVKWLSKLGIEYVERPHMHSTGSPDQMVKRMIPEAMECPENAEDAAALAMGQTISAPQRSKRESRSGKWIRSASRALTGAKKLETPMPLSQFAQENRRKHRGNGRRDALEPRERTRVLRMLRDEGGRLAHEDSQVYQIEASLPPEPARVPKAAQKPRRQEQPRRKNESKAPQYGSRGGPASRSDRGMAPMTLPPGELVFPDEGRPPPADPYAETGYEGGEPREAVIVGLAQAKAKRSAGGPQRDRMPSPLEDARVAASEWDEAPPVHLDDHGPLSFEDSEIDSTRMLDRVLPVRSEFDEDAPTQAIDLEALRNARPRPAPQPAPKRRLPPENLNDVDWDLD